VRLVIREVDHGADPARDGVVDGSVSAKVIVRAGSAGAERVAEMIPNQKKSRSAGHVGGDEGCGHEDREGSGNAEQFERRPLEVM
jgi:hypothetical protein